MHGDVQEAAATQLRRAVGSRGMKRSIICLQEGGVRTIPMSLPRID